MKTFKSAGVVLKRINYTEADQIITVYTKDYGKISLLAKGVRKITSRKKGSLEIFNQINFFAARTVGMSIVTEVETINDFSCLRGDLKKVAAAYEISEFVDKLTVEENTQDEVYYLLTSYFDRLSKIPGCDAKQLSNIFGEEILKILGFWPVGMNFPDNFNVCLYIEEIIEKEIKSRKFLNKV